MVKGLLVHRSRNDVVQGLEPTERDVDFLRFVGKWWCVNADAFVRTTHDVSEWKPVYIDGDEEQREKWVYSVRRRMNKWTKLDQYAPLTMARVPHAGAAYWLTSAGGDLVDAPWSHYPMGNVTRAMHSWATCDVGTELERMGYTIFSEREFSRGKTILNETIEGTKPEGSDRDKGEIAKELGARPDFALGGENGRFIYGEVERERGAHWSKYEKKLTAYFADDERVGAVWYFVSSTGTAKKIKAVYEKLVSEGMREMPVRLMPLKYGAFNYAYTDRWSAQCGDDLVQIGIDYGDLVEGKVAR